MYKRITLLHQLPLAVGSAAIYHYNPKLLEACERKAKYNDEVFNLARVVGTEFQKRLWIPRNMSSKITQDLRTVGLNVRFTSTFVPRNSEQSRCISEVVTLLQAGTSFVFEAPTGFGKTWCAADIIGKIGKKTIVVVTKEDILDQWVEAFQKVLGLELGKGIGIIKGDNVQVVGQKVVIAMIQSVAREARYPESIFHDFGLAVWDETHRAGADFFSQSCFRIPALLRLGISATPDRKDGREEVVEAHIGPTMVVSKAMPMIPRVIAQKSPWQIPLKRKTDKEGRLVLDAEDKVVMVQIAHSPGKCGHVIRMLSNNFARNKLISNFVSQAFKAGRKVLVQSDRKEHLEVLTAMIASSGVPLPRITYYVGGLTKAQRELAKVGSVIMATYAMTAEATDIPDLDTLVMASPKSDITQIVGRILRFVPDKKEPVVFDIVDDSSSVFSGYANNRLRWYKSIGAKVAIQD
jgi:superfamily II DNA or RNA helicase